MTGIDITVMDITAVVLVTDRSGRHTTMATGADTSMECPTVETDRISITITMTYSAEESAAIVLSMSGSVKVMPAVMKLDIPADTAVINGAQAFGAQVSRLHYGRRHPACPFSC